MTNRAKRVTESSKPAGTLYGVSVEYGLHTLLWLLSERPRKPSSRDLAEMQGIPPAAVAKLLPKLQRAGIVRASDGIQGGYELAKPASDVTVLDVVDAIEGAKSLFDCREIRRRCVLFGRNPPSWSVSGMCRIHAVMVRAEKQMRSDLARTSLEDLARGGRPRAFEAKANAWFEARSGARETNRLTAMKRRRHALP